MSIATLLTIYELPHIFIPLNLDWGSEGGVRCTAGGMSYLGFLINLNLTLPNFAHVVPALGTNALVLFQGLPYYFCPTTALAKNEPVASSSFRLSCLILVSMKSESNRVLYQVVHEHGPGSSKRFQLLCSARILCRRVHEVHSQNYRIQFSYRTTI